jgi:outer membrane protein OmpA-like peptidoglycan-associated protein
VVLYATVAIATPTQFGVSGLLSQPSADTLESGNISVGLWLNGSQLNNGEAATILPFSLTLGLGQFIEAYGSYPNLMFNDEEADSGRGFANIGIKTRVLGKRSSPYKLAVDLQARRHVADNASTDGETGLLARAIATFKSGRVGVHVNAGFLKNNDSVVRDDQVVAGAALEYFPMARLRLIAELDFVTARTSGFEEEIEVMAGLQYFYSPHLTFHAGLGIGLTGNSPDWRFLAGVSTSQGIGTFTKPIPQIISPVLPVEKTEKVKKISKFKTITPLLPMSRLAKPAPVVNSELPVNPGEEKIIIEPETQLKLAKENNAKSTPVTPISSPAPERVNKDQESYKIKQPINTVVYRRFRFEDVNFAFDQYSLSEAGIKALSQVADSLRKEKKWFLIRIDGHTDSVGSPIYNDKLSYRRAASVGQQLVTREGFDPARIFIKGFGESIPVASNKTAEGRRLNRRSEILVLLPEKGD